MKREVPIQKARRLVPVGEYLSDSSGGCIYVNEKWSEFTGLWGDSVMGDGWRDALHPDDRELVISKWQEAVKNQTDFEAEYRFLRPDGEVAWVQGLATANFAENGQFLGHVGANIEVTARKQAEDLFRTLLEAAPDATIVVDGDGSILLVNAQAQSLFGYSREELLSKKVEDLIPAHARAEHLAFRKAYSKIPRTRPMGGSMELHGLRGDGTEFVAEVSLSPIETSEGTFISAAIRDATERKTAENKLRELQSELNQGSRWSMMGMLGATLAHELNQPMTAVMNYVRASQRILEAHGDRVPQESMDLMTKAIEQTDVAGKIIQNLRQFVERGETEYAIVDVNLIVGEISAASLPAMWQRGVNFRFHPGADLPSVLIDRVRIQQVIENLFRNAIEAMEARNVRELTIETSLAGDGSVGVAVSDSGSGISPEVAGTLFKPFATTKISGMGVGLAISRSIVLAHGGQLWTEPKPGGGSVFRFTVPVAAMNGDEHAT